MISRPLDALELSAIRAYLEQCDVTRCPDTGRGEVLPHLRSRGMREVIHLEHRAAEARRTGERKAA